MSIRRMPLPCTVQVLERVGFKFAIDYDGSLVWSAPESIDVHALTPIVEQWSDLIALGLLARASRDRARFYGGPLDGKRCVWIHPYCGTCVYFKGVKFARAKWATYRLEGDGRAYFVGYAKSEAKARRGKVEAADA